MPYTSYTDWFLHVVALDLVFSCDNWIRITWIHTQTHKHTHTYTHTNTYTYIHTQIHTHLQTHTLILVRTPIGHCTADLQIPRFEFHCRLYLRDISATNKTSERIISHPMKQLLGQMSCVQLWLKLTSTIAQPLPYNHCYIIVHDKQ